MQMSFYVSEQNLEMTRKAVASLDSLRIISDFNKARIGSEGKGYGVLHLSVEGDVKDMNRLYAEHLSIEQGRLAWRQNAN